MWIGLSSSYPPGSRYTYQQILVLAFGTLITPWRTPTTALMRWLSFMVVVFSTFVAGLVLLRQPSVDERRWRGLPIVFSPLASVAPVYTFFFVSPLLEGARYLYLAECAWAIIVAHALTSAVARGTAYPTVGPRHRCHFHRDLSCAALS